MDLLIHPIYRKAQRPEFLDENEAEKLQKGEVANLLKITKDNHGNKTEMLIEYDADTKEFIVSDTEKILAPDMVNNEFLTAAQKENYRKGREVEIACGTKFSYSDVDHHGIRANKLALVASILMDGGLSYVVYGMANLDYRIPITTTSAFDIASVSKQFTGACIALLIIDGKLRLDMPASHFIPELGKYRDTIRIEHLIYNTSGITNYYKLPRVGGRSWVTFDYFNNEDCIRTSLSPDTLAFKPGTKWDYCNVNFMLLAKIVEKVSGKSFSAFARNRLFLPLGMDDTIVNDDATAIISNRVTPYNPRTKDYVDAYCKAGFEVNYGSGCIQHPRNSPHYGGSGIDTTVNDLIKWEMNFSAWILAVGNSMI